jgi:DNA-binding response OmpR family regulator
MPLFQQGLEMEGKQHVKSAPEYTSDHPILIVDDDPSFVSIVTTFMAKAGWRYEVAIAGQQAIARLTMDSFAAVLLDLNLPDINGLDVLRAVADLPSAPPVVFISGDASIQSALDAGRFGAVEFLEKPISPSVIMARLGDVIHRSPSIQAALVENEEADPLVAGVSELILTVVRNHQDVRTMSEWAGLVCLTEKTLATRCRRIGLPAKAVLDLARLLRIVAKRPRSVPTLLMFSNLDKRAVSALFARAGLTLRDVETLTAPSFLQVQQLVDHPPLIRCLSTAF